MLRFSLSHTALALSFGLSVAACAKRPAEQSAPTSQEVRAPRANAADLAQGFVKPPTQRAQRQRVRAQGQLGPGRGTLVLGLSAPKGAKLTEGAPIRVEARGKHAKVLTRVQSKLSKDKLPLRLELEVVDGATEPVELDLNYYWCREGQDGSCRPEKAHLLVELDYSGDSPGGEAFLSHSPGS